MERELVALGRVAHLVARGRTSGEPRSVAVGFVDESDGSVLVAANGPEQDWAQNLLHDPEVAVEIGPRSFRATAEPLDGPEHSRAVRGLILRYGTPSEGLGRGPSFRLRPLAAAPGEPAESTGRGA
jgi:deazaflavin-dependent oxidoreductase (nitroreductase family)